MIYVTSSGLSFNNNYILIFIIFISFQLHFSSASERFHVLLFDSYGTLFDINSLTKIVTSNITSNPESFVALWRRKQIEYTWQRSLMGKKKYKTFWKITQDALEYTLKYQKIQIIMSEKKRLMNGWLHLPIFPDVKNTLNELKDTYQLAILSNGSPGMLWEVIKFNQLDNIIDPIISVNDVRIYKPSPIVYSLGKIKLHVPKSKILFVSSNFWDSAGAKSLGFTDAWINRQNDPQDYLDEIPDFEFSNLTQLKQVLLND